LNIAYYRKKEGMTQEQLAEKAGISWAYLSKIEAPNMAVNMSVDILFQLADALRVAPTKLLDFRD